MELKWDQISDKRIHSGVSKCVLFPCIVSPATNEYTYDAGVAWSGITGIDVNNDGGDYNANYADNIDFFGLRGKERKQLDISAFTYPDEFGPCIGEREPVPGLKLNQQIHKMFGLCWRSEIHSATDDTDNDYVLHFAYGCTANSPDVENSTEEDDIEPYEFEFEAETTPVEVVGPNNRKYRSVSYLTVDSSKCNATKLAELERMIYGTADTASMLPLPTAIITLLNTDNAEATYTAVTNPTGNPSSQDYYELVDGHYVATTDTEVVSGKTYYTANA